MNYIKQLTYFFTKVSQDSKITPTHISLFMALFQEWNKSRFKAEINIIRDDMMALAKINSRATYHRAMTFLHENQYIQYEPSYNPIKGSKIAFFPTEKETKISKTCTNITPVQNLTTRLINEPYNKLYSTNIIQDNISTSARDQKSVSTRVNNSQLEKEKSCAKKEKEIPPANHLVEEFFIVNNSNSYEAQKFLNHYNANGWLVGGKTPMKDWQASARNWISNTGHFNKSSQQNTRAQQLQTPIRKNYFEPL